MPTKMTREDFFSLWERLPEPVLVTDGRQLIQCVNLAFESLMRHGRSELLNKSIDVLLPELSRSRHHTIAQQFIDSGENQRKLAHPRLIRAHRADGVDVPVEVAISSAEVEGQRYFVLLFRDLTEQLSLQEEVASLTQRLARIERIEALSTLAAGLSAEFGAVLSRLREASDAAQAALERSDLSAALAEVASLRGQLADAAIHTHDLQLFARREFTAPMCAPGPALERAVRRAGTLTPPGVHIKLVVDRDLPTISAVDEELEQALTNLLNNALYAMRGRTGKVTVLAHQLELEAPMACTTLTLTPGSWFALSVEDEGVGVEPVVLQRMFDPFFTTKPKGEGTGLGLSMVYGFVRSANGAANVESRPGHGTRLTLFLPVTEAAAGAEVMPREPSRKRRVLLVDADTFVATSLRRSLELLGHACHVVSHGGDALSLIRLDPAAFDLIVADLSLPGMRGDELASRLTLIRPSLPVCVIVGSERLPPSQPFRVLRRPATALDIDMVLRTVVSPTPLPIKGS